jgi:hypothetical protein
MKKEEKNQKEPNVNNKNPVQNWWNNLKNTRKNYKKVKSSPYASLLFAIKVRKMILIPLILFIIWKGIQMVINYKVDGFMGLFGRLVMLGIFIYLVYKIYATIPAAKRQLEYYKKHPHTINYCPTNVKEDVDDILKKIKENKKKKENDTKM